jgi:hypothetical protein
MILFNLPPGISVEGTMLRESKLIPVCDASLQRILLDQFEEGADENLEEGAVRREDNPLVQGHS